MYKSPCLLIDKIREGIAAPVDCMALINTNIIPSIGPEYMKMRAKDIPNS